MFGHFLVPKHHFNPLTGWTDGKLQKDIASGAYTWFKDEWKENFPPMWSRVRLTERHDVCIDGVAADITWDLVESPLNLDDLQTGISIEVPLEGKPYRIYFAKRMIAIQNLDLGNPQEVASAIQDVYEIVNNTFLMNLIVFWLKTSRKNLFSQSDVTLLNNVVDGNSAQKRGNEIRDLAARLRFVI
jgi:hypothetical protein